MKGSREKDSLCLVSPSRQLRKNQSPENKMALLENDKPVTDFLFDTDEYPSDSSEEQKKVESSVLDLFRDFCGGVLVQDADEQQLDDCPVESLLKEVKLLRGKHVRYLKTGLRDLPGSFESLDANRPWLCYWIVHALALLEEEEIDPEISSQIVAFLSRCQCPSGGFGGGPGQYAHVAATYASVMTLCTLGTKEAYEVCCNTLHVFFFAN